MAQPSNYNPSSAVSIADEVALGKDAPVDPGNLHRTFVEPGGMPMADPEWDVERFMPLIEGKTERVTIGRQFDHLPDNLSFQLYGTYDLWPLLMRLNGALTRADFVGPDFVVVRASQVGVVMDAYKKARQTVVKLREAGSIPAHGDLTVRPVYVA